MDKDWMKLALDREALRIMREVFAQKHGIKNNNTPNISYK